MIDGKKITNNNKHGFFNICLFRTKKGERKKVEEKNKEEKYR